MEDKVNYTVVGAFVLALGAALIGGVLWLSAGVGGTKRYDPYQSIVEESVAGLNIDAPVKYLGVNVGKVTEIGINPANTQQVRLLFLIERGTPIKQNTEAVLKSEGLTGIAYVELDGGTAGSQTLVVGANGDIPTIRSKPSLSARLESVLSAVLANVDRMSSNLNAVFDADNRAALKATLADTAALAHSLAAQQETIRQGIINAARVSGTMARVSEQLGPAIDRISASAAAVEDMAGVARNASASAGRTADAATSGVQQLSTKTLPEMERLLGELNQLAGSLRRLSEQTERSPNSLIFGAPTVPPGPGEKP